MHACLISGFCILLLTLSHAHVSAEDLHQFDFFASLPHHLTIIHPILRHLLSFLLRLDIPVLILLLDHILQLKPLLGHLIPLIQLHQRPRQRFRPIQHNRFPLQIRWRKSTSILLTQALLHLTLHQFLLILDLFLLFVVAADDWVVGAVGAFVFLVDFCGVFLLFCLVFLLVVLEVVSGYDVEISGTGLDVFEVFLGGDEQLAVLEVKLWEWLIIDRVINTPNRRPYLPILPLLLLLPIPNPPQRNNIKLPTSILPQNPLNITPITT